MVANATTVDIVCLFGMMLSNIYLLLTLIMLIAEALVDDYKASFARFVLGKVVSCVIMCFAHKLYS